MNIEDLKVGDVVVALEPGYFYSKGDFARFTGYRHPYGRAFPNSYLFDFRNMGNAHVSMNPRNIGDNGEGRWYVSLCFVRKYRGTKWK